MGLIRLALDKTLADARRFGWL